MTMKRTRERIREAAPVAVFLLSCMAILLCAAALSGCSPRVEYVPVERPRVEYRDADTTALMARWRSLIESMRTRERTSDSVVDKERESVTLNDKGDTVRLTRDHYIYVSSKREKELEREVHEKDSLIKKLRTQLQSVKVDSVPVPYPVERPLSKWEQTKMDFGGMAIGAVLVILCAAALWMIRKFRK